MAQLIKLQDYVTRYAQDLNGYPSQFIRLKREQWLKVKNRLVGMEKEADEQEMEHTEPEKRSLISQWVGRKRKPDEVAEDSSVQAEEETVDPDEQFEPDFIYEPNSEEEVRKMFADQLFYFQLKWASSTMLEQSVVHSRYYRDTFLRQLLRSLPDSYLLLYRPVLQLKKAPVELDTVLIGPSVCYCITTVEDEEDAVFSGGTDRFWQKRLQRSQGKFLSPLISLDRTETVVSRLLEQRGIDLPVRKVLISRNGFFDITSPLYGVECVDKRGAQDWFHRIAGAGGPFKRAQFQAAEALLTAAVTVSYSRPATRNDGGESLEQ